MSFILIKIKLTGFDILDIFFEGQHHNLLINNFHYLRTKIK